MPAFPPSTTPGSACTRAAQPPTIGVHDGDQWPAPFACDFIFASRELRPRLRSVAVESATAASDHQPMLLELG